MGAIVTLTGLGLAGGALRSGEPAMAASVELPWVVALVLFVCGILIVREALTGGFRRWRNPPAPSVAGGRLVWVSAGLLAKRR